MNNSAKLLLVDDTPANLVILQKSLTAPAYETISATGGLEAIRLARESMPDLILLDIMMPGVDGFEVAKQLRHDAVTKSIPIIFLTALDDPKIMEQGFAAGAVDFITKPFRIAELKARVNIHVEITRLRGKLEIEVERRTQELTDALKKVERSNAETLKRLCLAAEYRDNETSNHLKRMSKVSMAIAKAAGLDDKNLEYLALASQMHDVGKIGIPDGILLKPGKLTPEELEVMKRHPQIGGDLLANIDSEVTWMAESIALTHHEKYDGSGYPKGLKGEAIPLEGRIVAIADVFDALTSERPYKKAWAIEDAVAHVQAGSGTHFDPKLIAIFNSILPEILAVHKELKE